MPDLTKAQAHNLFVLDSFDMMKLKKVNLS